MGPHHRSRSSVAAKASIVDLTGDDSDQERKQPPKSAKKKAKTPKKEKRAARYRSSCPQALRERFIRALGQRMYLVNKEKVSRSTDAGEGSLPYHWQFAMLGSTGNVYNVVLSETPTCTCPDFQRRQDCCKHMIFVLLRAVGLSMDDPLAYQKAYLTSEVRDLYNRVEQRQVASSSAWANSQVRSQYAKLSNGDTVEEEEPEKEGGVKRRSLEEDCPICLESLSSCPKNQVTYCKTTCGMNFHIACMQQWKRASAGARGNQITTCPNCRAVEAPSSPQRDSNHAEGYVNMGRLQGQSPDRDTSTYHQYSPYSSYRRRRTGGY